MTPHDLEDDQERLRLALVTGGIGTWDWDFTNGELRWNARHAVILGYPPETIRVPPERFFERVHPEDHALLERELARAGAVPGAEYAQRFRIVRADDGAVRWVDGRGRFFHGADGALLRGTGVLRDVTDEVEHAAALAASEERFRLALAGSEVGIWDVDAVRGLSVLDVVAERLGYTELGHSLEERVRLVHPEDRPRARAVLRDLEAGATDTVDFTIRVFAQDGSLRWLHPKGRVVARDPGGRATRIVGIVVDETEREENERRREAVTDLLAEALAHMPLLVALYDQTGRVLWLNVTYTEILGWSLGDLQEPGALAKLLADETKLSELERFMAAADGSTWKEFPTRTKDGRAFPTAWCNIRLPDGRILGIGKDSSLETQLAHAQKMESLGVLAGGIAHDFNNLLVGILGNASLAASETSPSSTIAPLLQDIEASALRAADLTRQLLAYAGKGRFVIEKVDVVALVTEMRSLLASVISKKTKLEITTDGTSPTVSADATQLRQVLMNLIVNGSDALGDREGAISVRVASRECPDGRAEHAALAPGRYAVIEVQDDGCGMTEAVRSRIFEPFFTTKFAGRGLGLAATLGIIRGHGGSLRVTSEVGRGSVFEVFLPTVPEIAGEGRADAAGRPSARPASEAATVLVVDDEPMVRQLAQRLLSRRGHRVLLAGDGREALETFAKERVDLVLLDLTMPHLSGEETLRELRVRAPGVLVVLMSGYDPAEVASRFAKADVAGFLQKPFDTRSLVRRVEDLLARAPFR